MDVYVPGTLVAIVSWPSGSSISTASHSFEPGNRRKYLEQRKYKWS